MNSACYRRISSKARDGAVCPACRRSLRGDFGNCPSYAIKHPGTLLQNPDSMSEGILFTISAPSGAGKTRLVKAMIEREPGLVLSISHTTRPRRPGETDGQDYHFVDPAAFGELVAQGAFLEHAEVYGHHYGTAQSSVERELAAGRNVMLEIDWQGAAQVRRLKPGSVSIFVLPPSREVLEERLRGRGQDSDEVIAARMAEARAEISHYLEADYLIVNDDFDRALQDALAVVRSEHLRQPRQAAAQAGLIRALLA